MKAVRGTYLKISAEKRAEIGQRAAEHGVLPMVRYYAMKIPVTTGTMCICSASWSGRGIFEQRIREMKFSKIAICENLYLRNISTIQYSIVWNYPSSQ